ncbi:hypothetical protein LCGC14_1138170 [marine sediment metagenome]|uniref:HD domain-containing protein n=1 Tax=marine sediment metagenome TaxID=412755 RepID=A0A0F9M3X0_9ZZZZ
MSFQFKSKMQVIDQSVATTKMGNPYIIVSMRDITDTLRNLRRWLNDEKQLEIQQKIFEIGNILEIECEFDKKYSSITVRDAKILTPSEYDIEDYVASPRINKNELIEYLFETISNIRNDKIKELLEEIFNNDDIKSRYIECPSSISKHHNYKHGNLEHSVNMIKLFKTLEDSYNRNTNLDNDLIYAGIILHDLGKIFEYSIYNGVPAIIPGSNLYGHPILGVELVSKFMKRINKFPNDLKNKVRHLILSHHSKKEWGSVVEPQFPEAEFLHYLDMVDSRYKLKD